MRMGGGVMQADVNPRGVSIQVTFWMEDDGSIRLVGDNLPGLCARIRSDPERPSGHPTLFRQLTGYLRTLGRETCAPVTN